MCVRIWKYWPKELWRFFGITNFQWIIVSIKSYSDISAAKSLNKTTYSIDDDLHFAPEPVAVICLRPRKLGYGQYDGGHQKVDNVVSPFVVLSFQKALKYINRVEYSSGWQ